MATYYVELPQTEPDSTLPPSEGPRRKRSLHVMTWGLLALSAIVYHGIHARATAEAKLRQAADEAAIPTVSVTHPKMGDGSAEIVLPGTVQAFTDSPIFARTNGYLKRWYFDIGARVRKGQLLAEIETPELDQQLRQARADLATAESNLNLARITAERDEHLLKTHSVSTQERDNAVNGLSSAQSTVESNRANVARLEQLQSFEKICAPFDGVITARSTDVGALVDAGANSPKELFHLGAIQKLRVYVSVPETYSRAARPGATARLTLDEFPGQVFRGTLIRNSSSFDTASRTLLAEIDVDNPSGQLLPGAYAQVHLKLPESSHSLTIPANTLLFRSEGLRVGVVRNGKAELVPISVGRDYGSAVEVVAGLQPADELILDPSDSLTSGTVVRVKTPAKGGRQ